MTKTWRTERLAAERNIHDSGQPTESERREHMNTHRPHRSWCKFRVMERGVNSPHGRSDAQDDLEGVPHVSMDYGGQVKPMLVIREKRHIMTWVMLLPRRGTEFPRIAKRAAKFVDWLGHNRVTLRCDNEPAIEAVAKETAQARQEGSQTPVGEPVQRSHRVHGGARGWPGQNTESCIGASCWRQSPARCKDTVLAGGVRCVSDEQLRHRQRRKNANTQTAWTKRQHTDSGTWREDFLHACQTSKRRKVEPTIPC